MAGAPVVGPQRPLEFRELVSPLRNVLPRVVSSFEQFVAPNDDSRVSLNLTLSSPSFAAIGRQNII